MAFNQKFQDPGEAGIVSYDFVDIASQTGVIVFYGGRTNQSGAYILSNNTYYSDKLSTAYSFSGTTWTLALDKDFDVTINKPFTINGTCIMSVPLKVSKQTGTSGEGRMDIYLRKVSGGVETDLLALSGATFTAVAADTSYYLDTVSGNVSNIHFKKGDTLRVTVMVYAQRNGGGDNTIVALGHDPANRSTNDGESDNWSTTPTTLKAHIPTRIDL